MLHPKDAQFNKHLKGKYAYWIHMRYVVPMDLCTVADYIKYEQDVEQLLNWRQRHCAFPDPLFWDLYGKHAELEAWVDAELTEQANNVVRFEQHNSLTTDADLTVEQVKRFRTWLAEVLLALDQDHNGRQLNSFYDKNFTKVLLYYRGNMYDEIVGTLSNIPTEYKTNQNIVNSGCSTCSDLSNTYSIGGSVCDPVSIYRHYIYKEMAAHFSDLDFWLDVPTTLILNFRQYIENILTLNLKLTQSKYSSVFQDCSCLAPGQTVRRDVLVRLSQALLMIAEDRVQGNKNYIKDAFTDWATELYENMYWD